MEFRYDGRLRSAAPCGCSSTEPGLEKERVEGTIPLVFSADETADIGRDTASPVSEDYRGDSSIFTRRVNRVQIDLGDDAEDADHLITSEERLKVVMARQ